jgi:hypothetical protein
MNRNARSSLIAGSGVLAIGLVYAWLAYDSVREPNNCEAVKAAHEKWLNTPALDIGRVTQEIHDLLIPNRCDGISPEVLRKILFDIVLLQSRTGHPGLSHEFSDSTTSATALGVCIMDGRTWPTRAEGIPCRMEDAPR